MAWDGCATMTGTTPPCSRRSDMSAAYVVGECAGEGSRSEIGDAAARRATDCRATDWLHLGAAPTFAIMSLLTCALGGQSDILCSAAEHTSPWSGMVPMYLLMSAFHSPPWLRLLFSRSRGTYRA